MVRMSGVQRFLNHRGPCRLFNKAICGLFSYQIIVEYLSGPTWGERISARGRQGRASFLTPPFVYNGKNQSALIRDKPVLYNGTKEILFVQIMVNMCEMIEPIFY